MRTFKIGSRVHVTRTLGYVERGAEGVVRASNAVHTLVQFEGRTDLHHGGERISADETLVPSEQADCWWFCNDYLSTPRLSAKPTTPKSTRATVILNHLISGRSLTQGEATLLGYGPNIARPIFALRKAGHHITLTTKRDIKGYPYGEYALAKRDAFGRKAAV